MIVIVYVYVLARMLHTFVLNLLKPKPIFVQSVIINYIFFELVFMIK